MIGLILWRSFCIYYLIFSVYQCEKFGDLVRSWLGTKETVSKRQLLTSLSPFPSSSPALSSPSPSPPSPLLLPHSAATASTMPSPSSPERPHRCHQKQWQHDHCHHHDLHHHHHHYHHKISFLSCILLIMLLRLSQFPPPLCPLPPSTPHSLRQSPHHCSSPWVMHISSLATPFPILYFTFPWLFCNYPFLLNPLTSLPIPAYRTYIWQLSKPSVLDIRNGAANCLWQARRTCQIATVGCRCSKGLATGCLPKRQSRRHRLVWGLLSELTCVFFLLFS